MKGRARIVSRGSVERLTLYPGGARMIEGQARGVGSGVGIYKIVEIGRVGRDYVI